MIRKDDNYYVAAGVVVDSKFKHAKDRETGVVSVEPTSIQVGVEVGTAQSPMTIYMARPLDAGHVAVGTQVDLHRSAMHEVSKFNWFNGKPSGSLDDLKALLLSL